MFSSLSLIPEKQKCRGTIPCVNKRPRILFARSLTHFAFFSTARQRHATGPSVPLFCPLCCAVPCTRCSPPLCLCRAQGAIGARTEESSKRSEAEWEDTVYARKQTKIFKFSPPPPPPKKSVQKVENIVQYNICGKQKAGRGQ